ncbi:Helix-turn-helix [Filimonas lacunae]|uniref:Helix-turn-helix n=2 Tax=Filimonas lacunae TaxID=477680 RepID=A0A173MAY0_9BACT|nr:helix-turn-helix transcriptional regulator [Filimonas lacunae]BAV04723.1 hypothetical protein FLA_0722 [Filimonas lacunae]SIT32283.1 Helix-turn-helix [Filimonas lacunae]
MNQKAGQILLTFATNLKKLREKKGYSQRGLASHCNIDNADISRMENGLSNVTLLTLEQLAEALECDVKDFFE